MSVKRYQLHKFDNNNPAAVPPCAFFATEKGCKSGDGCKFLHGPNDTRHAPPVTQHVTPPDPLPEEVTKKRKHKKEKEVMEDKKIRTENSSHLPVQSYASHYTQGHIAQVATSAPIQDPSREKLSKKKRSEKKLVEKQPDVPPGFQSSHNNNISLQYPVSPFSPNAVKREEEEDASFLFGVVNTAIAQGSSDSNRPGHISHGNSSVKFVDRSTVDQRLQTSGTEHATAGSSHQKNKKVNEAVPVTLPSSTSNIAPTLQFVSPPQQNVVAAQQMQLQQSTSHPQPQTPAIPTVLLDESIIHWRPYVQATVSNPRFSKDYNFEVDNSWVKAKPYGEWCENLPPIVAIDCEMCETSDPVTGIKDGSTLIRFSMVNGLNPSEVIVDSLVNPLLPVTNMRSHIHGINEEALRNVQFTLRHAQAILMNTISDRTVIVGHALHHDFKSLKFNHYNVVDTSYIYQIANEPGASPSLRECAQQTLNESLSPYHDSVEDAKVALLLAAHVVKNGFQPPLARVGGARTENQSSLLIHRIPKSCSEDQIKRMFAVNSYVIPKTVNPIQHPVGKDPSANVGRTDAVFETAAHAELAFDTLPGPDRPDKGNRSQKRVYLQGGGYMCVRKY